MARGISGLLKHQALLQPEVDQAFRADATGLGLLTQPFQEIGGHCDIVPTCLNVHVEFHGVGFGLEVCRVAAIPEITYLS